MSIIRILLLAALAYFAYTRYSWPGAIGVVLGYVVLFIILSFIGNTINANRARQHTARLVSQKLSDAEKTHLGAQQAHQQAMHDRKAQFDPELRKSRGE